MVKGRIAVLLGQGDEDHQEKFITGAMKQAFSAGYDVCVFSMYIKYQNTPERDKGDSEIFNLINYDMFDAVIIMSDTIQVPGLIDRLEEDVSKKFSGPVICVDRDSKYFKSFWTDGYQLVYSIVSHLIEIHGMRDIAFLTGKKWHRHSQRRLEAYIDCMEAHDLQVRDDRIFYGDFWYTSGDGCADALLSQGRKMPDAVACANDCMAIGLINAFEKRGIKVPEEIAVTGYGTSEEGQTSPKPLTSTYIPSEYYGRYSVECVLAMLRGEDMPDKKTPTKLFIGSSCGCEHDKSNYTTTLRDTWETSDSTDGFLSIHNLIQEDMLKENSLKGFFEVVYSYIFQLGEVDGFHLFMNENNNTFGYSDRVLHAISYHADKDNDNSISVTEFVKTDLMLGELYEQHAQPKGYIFTPIFFEDSTHGYAVVSYGDVPRSYDSEYRLWITAVARGLEAVKRNIELMRLKTFVTNTNTFEKRFVSRGDTPNMAAVTEEERNEMETVERILIENSLTYVFQPIVEAKGGTIFAYEALMRSGIPKLSPLKILKYAESLGRLGDIEKSTFINVLGIIEENEKLFEGKKVFINSIPGISLEDSDREKIVKGISKNPDRVVVEITESAEMEDEDFKRFKHFTRDNGVKIAVDDYGTGYSNISNLLRYMPEYVKIDRALITNIQNDMNKQHFVREIVKFCHDGDIKALAEGVETSEELAMVMNLGVDLIQGYYTARPNAEIIPEIDEGIKSEIVRNHQDFENKNTKSIYNSGRSGRINLGTLVKEGYSSIEIRGENVTYRDITIAGAPGIKNEIAINVVDGYYGTLTFENIALFSIKNQPCVTLGKNVDLTIILKGDNHMRGGGIMVPKGSKLTLRGDGDLNMMISANNYFAIGNTINNECGELNFLQDGEIKVFAKGKEGIGIGAGMGGDINISRGKYEINLAGECGVGIGTMDADTELNIQFCDMTIDLSTTRGVCVGSINGSVDISMSRSSFGFSGGGSETVICGTLKGRSTKFKLAEATMRAVLSTTRSTIVGALNGSSVIYINKAQFKADSSGRNALIFGGYSDDNKIVLKNVDTKTALITEQGRDTFADESDITIINGRSEFKINDKIIERNRVVDTDELN